jgi:hypothetical protein
LSTLTIAFVGEVVGGSLNSSIEGSPVWLDEAPMRERLASHYKSILEDYVALRERRAQD